MDLKFLENRKIFVTGATGLIGATLIKEILSYNNLNDNKIKIAALIRNLDKAKKIFGKNIENIEFIISDVRELKPQNIGADFVIHCASETASKFFVDKPVETIMLAIGGTKRVLDFAVENSSISFVYLSTMEVYGTPTTDDKIYENTPTNLNTMAVRSSYPEAKRAAESLCAAYFKEYGLSTKVVRLTQTFGEGIAYNDTRVFAEFARCAIEGRDIVLHTKGETKRNYLYVGDAVNAIFTVLEKGKPSEVYNAANEATYCSIYEMAQLVSTKCADGKINVVIKEEQDISKFGYAPVLKMNLSSEKLMKLGWMPKFGLEEMYKKMMPELIL